MIRSWSAQAARQLENGPQNGPQNGSQAAPDMGLEADLKKGHVNEHFWSVSWRLGRPGSGPGCSQERFIKGALGHTKPPREPFWSPILGVKIDKKSHKIASKIGPLIGTFKKRSGRFRRRTSARPAHGRRTVDAATFGSKACPGR